MNRTLRKWLMLPFARRHVVMPGRSCKFDLSQQPEAERQLGTALRAHVDELAVKIGERHKGVPHKLALAREYIRQTLVTTGREVVEHPFADGVNISAGSGDIVIGAHYDSVPGSPGANDNATGIAAVLELARLMPNSPRLRFLAFDNEEHVGQPPLAMGSHVYAAECARRGERISGMWSLETLGAYSEVPHSQRYPSPFDLFYPTTATFVAFIGNEASRAWIHRSITAFRRVRPGFPSEGLASPAKFADINRSDHWGFWQAGYPALMVTDTANFRSDAYHTPADTPEKVNFRALARLVYVLYETLKELSES